MAEDDAFRRRRRERESEELKKINSASRGTPSQRAADAVQVADEDDLLKKLDELFERAEKLIEQLNGLYNQFASGTELRPPMERRRQLDQIIQTLYMMQKPTQVYQFRFNGLYSMYQTHRTRWENVVRRVESGE